MADKKTYAQFGQMIKEQHPEYKDMPDEALANAVLSKYPQYTDMVTEHGVPTPELKSVFSPLTAGKEFGKGFIHTIPDMLRHPVDTLKGMAQPLQDLMPNYGAALQGNGSLPGATAMQHGEQQLEGIERNPAYFAGGAISMLLAGKLGEMSPEAGSALRTAAIGDPNVAGLKGLRIPAGSPKSLSTVRAIEGARPYLQGAKSLEDVQAKLPAAKAEIWGPYKQTVDALSGKQINGPDGPTTVGELEAERQQLSALNRQLKSKAPNPEAVQLAQQKGMNQAQLLARERSVQNSLDPVLRDAGIDPKAIRRTFGQVAQVGERVSGKSTLAEKSQPYGLSKLGDVSLIKPLSNIPLAGDIARDIAAGRYWSAKPTDVALREAFRTGAEKPNLGAFVPGPPKAQPLQLEANVPGNAPFGEEPYAGSMNGIPERNPVRTTPPPPSRLALPAAASTGEVQPMLKYAQPYAEPFDPHFRPVNLDEYRNQLRNLVPPQQ